MSNILQFPGKLAMSPTGEEIAVSNTGRHEILIVSKDGILVKRIGCGRAGYKNGSFDQASFNSPQGLTWYKSFVYVADTENHAIRKVCTSSLLLSPKD